MVKRIKINSKIACFGHVKLRKNGNSSILTVPNNPYTVLDTQYSAYIRDDGTIIYKPIKSGKDN